MQSDMEVMSALKMLGLHCADTLLTIRLRV